jgi:hypothetical protein
LAMDHSLLSVAPNAAFTHNGSDRPVGCRTAL